MKRKVFSLSRNHLNRCARELDLMLSNTAIRNCDVAFMVQVRSSYKKIIKKFNMPGDPKTIARRSIEMNGE